MDPVKAVQSAGPVEGEVFDPANHRPSGRALARVAAAVCVGLAALLVVGVLPRVLHRVAMQDEERRAETALPRVRVARAVRATGKAGLTLPGSIDPLQETLVYARANGFVRQWLVDIGSQVKKGQVLVELEIPDVDDELRQAEAAAKQAQAGIAQAKSQLTLARETNRRYSSLGPSGVVSQQQVDQVQASFEVQEANVAAAEAAYVSARANVRRYEDLRSFGTLVAPFDGVVTLRTAEVGQLVTAGSTGQGQALFKVAEVDIVRVFIHVPQLYAAGIRVGMNAPTTTRETPGRVFAGKVTRTADELDMATRSLLTQVDIPNPDRTLVSGMYAQVSLDVNRQDHPLFVPATSVVFDAKGTRAALIHDGVVTWKKVDIDGDFGDRLAISSGLSEGDMVALTPSERLVEGLHVQTEDATPSESALPATSPKSNPNEVP
ncbi:MAG: efflux RND transporter periplasmic adaptor subunit [Polyangiaceae bacterium]|jgi:RND family efflux transporter MFP subunit